MDIRMYWLLPLSDQSTFGRVHAVGVDVMIKQYFLPTSAGYHTSTSSSPEELNWLKQNIKQELT